jgi:PTS system nitrogen regulatory IIA component
LLIGTEYGHLSASPQIAERESAYLNQLAPILEVDDVAIDVMAPDRHTLFAAAGAILSRHVPSTGRAVIADALEARERLASTALGQGVAIPHGPIEGLAITRAAVIRLREPLEFGAPDDAPVRLFVFLLVGERASQHDLDTLVRIAEMLSDRAVRERLMLAPDARALHAAIADWSSVHEG